MTRACFFLLALFWLTPAWAGNYHLDIARQAGNITVNGGIPGPVLRFTEGEDAAITVTNHMNEDTSVHWHGFLLPGAMDGVPGLNGFPGIKPGETFTYRFPIRQSGTYWYHAHSMAQEQDGLYGAIVITPKRDPVKSDRDYVVLLSDFTTERGLSVLNNLKMDSGYYNYHKRSVSDFFSDVRQRGFQAAWQNAREWGEMRMSPTDLSDVSGYTFLINGRQDWSGLFKPGERIRLRFINASSMTFYDVRIPGLKMTVVAADGQNIEPVTVDEFRFGSAETYDVIVEPKASKAYTIAAESIDRTGFALGTLTPRQGLRGDIPTPRPRASLTMADMGGMQGMDRHAMQSGWANASTPPGHKALDYNDLRYLGIQPNRQKPERTLTLRLNGSMERFIWTINGKKFEDAKPLMLRYGERLRMTFINDSMMAHPMHLHGMFVQLENGQRLAKLPNKHTVIVPPGQTVSVLLSATEPGEWALHCHLLYHMLGGMMTSVTIGEPHAP